MRKVRLGTAKLFFERSEYHRKGWEGTLVASDQGFSNFVGTFLTLSIVSYTMYLEWP